MIALNINVHDMKKHILDHFGIIAESVGSVYVSLLIATSCLYEEASW